MSKQARGAPFHVRDDTVHHDNAKCEAGRKARIRADRVDTDGKKPLCPECQQLNAKS